LKMQSLEKKMGFLTPTVPQSSGKLFASPPASEASLPSRNAQLNPDQIRQLVNDCISKHMYPSATFFADKLTTITQGEPNAVYLLAQCYFFSKQFRRAVHLLRARELLTGNNRRLDFLYLGSLCLAECKEWEECLAVLGETENTAIELQPDIQLPPSSSSSSSSSYSSSSYSSYSSSSSSSSSSSAAQSLSFTSLHAHNTSFSTPQPTQPTSSSSSSTNTSFSIGPGSSSSALTNGVDLRAAVSLLRGKIYEEQENRQRAIVWYKRALQLDCLCVEALDNLVQKRMLSHKEESSLLSSITFPPHLEWLKLVYQTKLQQHDISRNSQVINNFHKLEAEFGLVANLDLLAGVAEHHYYRNDFRKCYQLSKVIIDHDPYHHAVLPAYLCTLVELEMKSELFYCAHQLVEAYPSEAVAWFAVGCYYYLVGKYELARRFFSKSTTIQVHFAPGWIGFGNAFAAQEESDQAMAAYRTAARLFEGSHIPVLCIGMEYLRTKNLPLAHQFFTQTYERCPSDPLIFNELGVVSYQQAEYSAAVDFFAKALELCVQESLDSWEPTLFNLGHSYRKLGRFAEAVRYYTLALSVSPKKASVSSALGFTYHLMEKFDIAIQFYHKALGMDPRDTFTSDMLARALDEVKDRPMEDHL